MATAIVTSAITVSSYHGYHSYQPWLPTPQLLPWLFPPIKVTEIAGDHDRWIKILG